MMLNKISGALEPKAIKVRFDTSAGVWLFQWLHHKQLILEIANLDVDITTVGRIVGGYIMLCQ